MRLSNSQTSAERKQCIIHFFRKAMYKRLSEKSSQKNPR